MNLFQQTSQVYAHLTTGTARVSVDDFRIPDNVIRPLVAALRRAGSMVLAETGPIWYQPGSEWHTFFKALQLFHRALIGLPVAFCHESFQRIAGDFQQAAASLHDSQLSDLRPLLAEIQSLWQTLSGRTNPLLCALQAELVADFSTRLILHKTLQPYFPADSSGLLMAGSPDDFEVLPHHAPAPVNITRFICLGSYPWFQSWFVAPRAWFIDLISYQWLPHVSSPPDLLLPTGAHNLIIKNGALTPERSGNTPKILTACALSELPESPAPEPLDPEIDDNWLSLFRKTARGANARRNDVRYELGLVEAIALEFSDDSEVLLPAASNRFVLRPPHNRPVRVLATEIRENEFVALFTSERGDYFIKAADRILGRDSVRIRAIQHEWKEKLREKLRKLPATEVASQIRRLGSKIANVANVRSWSDASPYRIRTQDKEDFVAITSYLGYSTAAQNNAWDMLAEVHSAHLRANTFIKDKLLRKIEKSPLNFNSDSVRLELDHNTLVELRKVRSCGKPFRIDPDLLS